MIIEVCKSKLHKVTVTEANLQYVGSITIDQDLMDAANLIENEKVQVVNINNGERLDTYVIRGERGTGVICLNGPAARKVAVGDVVIIMSYAQMDFEEAKTFKPWLVFPDTETNKLVFVESSENLQGQVRPVTITWTGPWSMQARIPESVPLPNGL